MVHFHREMYTETSNAPFLSGFVADPTFGIELSKHHVYLMQFRFNSK